MASTLHLPHAALAVMARLRRQFRASEAWFILLAIMVGAAAGLATVALGAIARTLQHWMFRLPGDANLSAVAHLSLWQLLMLPLGGAVLAGFGWLTHARGRAMVDAVEANALHGGRMSVADSAVIAGQTVISNGFGASVGLEAGYAQLGGAFASRIGAILRLRRADLRTLVGAGAGAGIAAAFGAPLAGTFYAFEIVIGAYTPSAIAPIAAAALTGASVAQALGAEPYIVTATDYVAVPGPHYLLYALLGAVCAVIGVLLMHAVALAERASRALPLPVVVRPILGGMLLMPIAALSPQVLSSGHGALHMDLAAGNALGFIALVLLAKCAASVVSLGFGFRGGLFFASLFIGTLVGHVFAGLVGLSAGYPILAENQAAVVGMAALAVAIVGGPMTMAMLVLEATRDFFLTGAVIAASLVASTIVRERFGYSFSTWRLHLRGETIKSARDIGWARTLTAGKMMRRETQATPADTTIAEFRRRFPLGSASRVVLTGPDGGYAGIVAPAAAYEEGIDVAQPIFSIATHTAPPMRPDADILAVMARFDADQVDELAVVDSDGAVLGVLSEKFVRRRHAEEMEKAQRGLFAD